MRLSEAIAMGQGTVGRWEAGDVHHCAIGMACNSIGRSDLLAGDGDYDAIREEWPWTKLEIEHPTREGRWIEAFEAIYSRFDDEVMHGLITFEQFLDWVRSIEPPELEETANGDSAQTSAATEPVCPQKILR